MGREDELPVISVKKVTSLWWNTVHLKLWASTQKSQKLRKKSSYKMF